VSSPDRTTFAARWDEAVAARGDAPFLVFEASSGAVTTWSYSAFDDLVARVSGGLAAKGVEPGRAVHLALANSPSFVATWLAVARLGAWMVPSDPRATSAELDGHIGRTEPVVGVCAESRADVYHAAADGRVEVVAVDEDDPAPVSLLGAALTCTEVPPRPLDRLAVMFTSGTTSAPKGVEVTQANYAFAGDVMAAAAGLGADDRQLVVLPLFHANAQYYSFASAISAGASVALMHAFSASAFLTQAARHEATHASLFAAPMRMILARGGSPVDGLRLRHVWYAQNVTDDQYATLSGLFGCRPRQLYGLTETIPAVLTSRALAPVPGSMGEPSLGCEVSLRPTADAAVHDGEVPDGDVGEVVVRGIPCVTLFAGYLDDPVTTKASFEGEWFRTGDLARRDAAGRFYFAGRRSDVLKVAGENVSVVEVEAVLSEHPSVLEAAVVGEPDAMRDEVPVAFAVLRPDAAPATADDLMAWCAQRLSKPKRPVRVELVAELPRTSVGKIRKFLLRRTS
jgi:carnitine-CoA ligase